MTKIAGSEGREIIYLSIDGEAYNGPEIDEIRFPDEGHPFWEFVLHDGSIVVSSAAVVLRYK
ncbi:MAG TPA: hypothetical protein VGJ94_01805 [Syntrophorhabdaceae bacterium]